MNITTISKKVNKSQQTRDDFLKFLYRLKIAIKFEKIRFRNFHYINKFTTVKLFQKDFLTGKIFLYTTGDFEYKNIIEALYESKLITESEYLLEKI